MRPAMWSFLSDRRGSVQVEYAALLLLLAMLLLSPFATAFDFVGKTMEALKDAMVPAGE